LINRGVAVPDANLVDNVVMTAPNCFPNYKHLRLLLEKKQAVMLRNELIQPERHRKSSWYWTAWPSYL